MSVTTENAPRSRRALMAGLIGGLGAVAAQAIGRVVPVQAAAGSPLVIGSANQAATSNTSLNTTSSGFAWQMNQQGSGVGVFGISRDGNALAGLAHNGNKYGLSATNDGPSGTGAAVIADGRNNDALVADSVDGAGIRARSTNGYGVYGHSDNSDAGYFDGDVTVTGTLKSSFVGSSHFSTDDPNAYALDATHAAEADGTGAAILANGGNNDAIVASTHFGGSRAIRATSDSADQFATAVSVTLGGNPNTDSYAIRASTNGSGYGVYGSSANGIGVRGTGNTVGMYGSISNISGTGVRGTVEGGIGMYGSASRSPAEGTSVGVRGTAPGTAVEGTGGVYGCHGVATAVGGTGVFGHAQTTSGANYGVHGRSSSTSGRGVWGQSTPANGATFGVYGSAASPDGYGVFASGQLGTDKWLQMLQQSPEPAAPAAGAARLFARDGGGGKMQLCVLFPSGAVQVLATEP